ncbi:MAG: phosphonopyruvate decarboxylase [Gammaproteobacteria bacterium]|nr:phosphonopyruvate decarboxylase [Gammaproteobacteria bacterium]
MIEAADFIEAASARGFGLYAGVPCSYLTPFINYVASRGVGAPRVARDGFTEPPPQRLRYIGAANEGDAVAIAAGAALGGLPAIAMFQNSGLGNAVNPLTSLTWTFRIPVLLIVTWRGEPGGAADEPQHELMGKITPQMLEVMGIPWAEFPRETGAIGPALDRACEYMAAEQRPYALIMRKGSVADSRVPAPPPRELRRRASSPMEGEANATRRQMLGAIQMVLRNDDVAIATTGYTGRELYALGDKPCQLYMVGSMGCAASLGLGLAAARPEKRVVVIDGDGALLMRLGVLTTIGMERPVNLLHILLDNGMHESTGGQATVSPNVDFRALAAASGYPRVLAVSDPDEMREFVDWRIPGLRFIYAPVRPGVSAELPRPVMTPAEVAARLRAYLGPRYEM